MSNKCLNHRSSGLLRLLLTLICCQLTSHKQWRYKSTRFLRIGCQWLVFYFLMCLRRSISSHKCSILKLWWSVSLVTGIGGWSLSGQSKLFIVENLLLFLSLATQVALAFYTFTTQATNPTARNSAKTAKFSEYSKTKPNNTKNKRTGSYYYSVTCPYQWPNNNYLIS